MVGICVWDLRTNVFVVMRFGPSYIDFIPVCIYFNENSALNRRFQVGPRTVPNYNKTETICYVVRETLSPVLLLGGMIDNTVNNNVWKILFHKTKNKNGEKW